MSIRNLEHFFKPRTIALVGASAAEGSIGRLVTRNLRAGGFRGAVMLVNPKHRVLDGAPVYPDVDALPAVPDLAVVCTPPAAVPGIILALGARGTRAAVVITAGFGELAADAGRGLQTALLEAARPHLLRIIGPNCLGVLSPAVGLNASFAHMPPAAGDLAFVAQSGAIITSVLDWAQPRGIGFSHLVSLGDMIDADFGDLLDYLANDARTQAILLYIEALTHARKFMSAARAAARTKPVIVVKGGRQPEGARAVASHTGAVAGRDAVYDTAFQRAGMLRVHTLEELFDAVETLAMARRPEGDRLAILTNGGGIGVLATDALVEQGGRLAGLSPETVAALDAVLPPTWSGANPVDIVGDATGARYQAALAALQADRGIDGVLVLNCPTAMASGAEVAQAVVEAVTRGRRVPVLTSWVGDSTARAGRQRFAEHRVPTYDTPEQAVRAFMHLVDYQRSQTLLTETPPSVPEAFSPDVSRARGVIEPAMHERRTWLTNPETKTLLAAYGVPVVATRTAGTPDEAAAVAAEMGGAVALKILSPDLTHKSDVGGIALGLAGPAAVREAARAMQARVAAREPAARLTGFIVEPMVERPGAYELIVGSTVDPQFGPLVVFGQGGTAIEVINDTALGLPPLNMRLASALVERTRIAKLLAGFRGRPAANLDAIAMTLIRVAQIVVDHPEVGELDVNPLLADEYGVLALDARLGLTEVTRPGSERLAIRPYPAELEQPVPLGDGRTLLLRPIRPEDEPALQAAFARLTPEEVRLRFFVPLKTFSHMVAARFTQIDYDREMVLVLTQPATAGATDIYGVVQISSDPDNRRAEYAILLRGDVTGMGLGVSLMRRIIDYARSRGIGEIYGDVLQDNFTMLKLCRALGFRETHPPDDPGIVRVRLAL